MAAFAPDRQLQLLQQRLHSALGRLHRGMRNRLLSLRQALREQGHALDTVSPLATLGRGYSITTTEDGRVIDSYGQVTTGATIHTRLARGTISSIVQSGTGQE